VEWDAEQRLSDPVFLQCQHQSAQLWILARCLDRPSRRLHALLRDLYLWQQLRDMGINFVFSAQLDQQPDEHHYRMRLFGQRGNLHYNRMNKTRCLCSIRPDIRCDTSHCDIAGPGQPGNPNQCRICWLRLNKPPSVARPSGGTRWSPCLFLGEVLDKLGCSCPAKWIRTCAIHKVCNLDQCKSCSDYEEA
jgi:hypothetical protein